MMKEGVWFFDTGDKVNTSVGWEPRYFTGS